MIWTGARSRFEPDGPASPPAPVPQTCAWFEERGFEREWVSGEHHEICCGAHRFAGTRNRWSQM